MYPTNSSEATHYAAEARIFEQQAIDKDRAGSLTEAVDLYSRAAAKFSIAASQLSPDHPDNRLIINHRIEVLRRVDYLQSLYQTGSKPIPVENHISQVKLSILASTQSSSGSEKSSSKTYAASAAIGGIGGLALLGPVGLVAGAAGAAYCATRTDAVGSSVRGVADGGVTAVRKLGKIDDEYKITNNAKRFGAAAASKAKEVNEKYHVVDNIKSGANTCATTVKNVNDKYKITDKCASAISTSFSTMSRWLSSSSHRETDGNANANITENKNYNPYSDLN